MRLPTPAPLRDAETDLVWVIVPFSRPENAQLVIDNFKRQLFPLKKLVLVINGRAQIAFDRQELAHLAPHASLLLSSDAHQSAAKNTALAEIRKRGGGFTAVMDDDDWYGPQYLTEAAGYARSFDIIGKSRHFMSVDGRLWLSSRELESRRVGWLTGGTIACWAENSPEYPQVAYGEDMQYCAIAASRGMRMSVFGTSLYHYLYRRNTASDHTWRITSETLRQYESSKGALDLGPEDLDIVTGSKLDIPTGRALEARDRSPTLAPPPPGVQTCPT